MKSKCPACDYRADEFASVAMHYMRCHVHATGPDREQRLRKRIRKLQELLRRTAAMKLIPLLLFALTARADLLTIPLSTNRFTNPAPVRVEAIQAMCPICGARDHHRREIRSYIAFDLVTVLHVLDGALSTNYVTGPLTNWSTTNVVAIASRQQPGWITPPPMPGAAEWYILTNRSGGWFTNVGKWIIGGQDTSGIRWAGDSANTIWPLDVPPSGDTHYQKP